MEKLKLSEGLIAIGAAEMAGKTSFAIRLANLLAKKERVLFLNWTDYADRLHQIITKSNNSVNDKLDINTNVGYFNIESFIEIMELIETHNYSTIFIDDINYFTQIGETFDLIDQYNLVLNDCNEVIALSKIDDNIKNKNKIVQVFNLKNDSFEVENFKIELTQ